MAVVPFKRPPDRKKPSGATPQVGRRGLNGGGGAAPPPAPEGRSLGQFFVTVTLLGVAFFLLPTLWSSVPQQLLAVINLIVAAAYARFVTAWVPYTWIVISLVLLVLTGAPSPVTYAIARGVELLGTVPGL